MGVLGSTFVQKVVNPRIGEKLGEELQTSEYPPIAKYVFGGAPDGHIPTRKERFGKLLATK